jgi:CRISPR-associated protein (TIGR02710 family)
MEQLDTSNETREEKTGGSGYEVIEDLLLNAERRGTQRRYDDAVGRIYRATELFAQIFLFQNYSIVTGNVDLDRIPPEVADMLMLKSKGSAKKSIKLGLVDSYRLLAELDDTHQIGRLYKEQEKRLWSALEIRNSSILAHGVRPVHSAQYQSVHEALVTNFLAPALKIVEGNKKPHDVKQFPRFFGPRKNY